MILHVLSLIEKVNQYKQIKQLMDLFIRTYFYFVERLFNVRLNSIFESQNQIGIFVSMV